MSRASPQMRDFAKRLILYEAAGNKSAPTTAAPAFSACEKLRPQLATLMGNGGFLALLSRALVLGGAEVPWLRAARVKADGSLEGVEDLPAQLDAEELLEGRVVLLAQLLGLLVAFIGADLTLRLVREAWPKVPLHHLDFVQGDKK